MKVASTRAATVAVTTLAPISWGTTYVTITELLPDRRPLLVAAMRVLPAGLALLAAGRLTSSWRPRRGDWARTAALAATNFALFFPLLVLAVYRLPGGVAAAAGGLQPLLVAGLSWAIVGRHPRSFEIVVGIVAAAGVGLVVIRPGGGFDPLGVTAAVAANVSFATGVVLTKRSSPPPNPLAATGWQLVISAAVLVPLAAVVEGPPPAPTLRNVAGFTYLALAATALAFVVWFHGVRRLPAVVPPLLGLAAPVTGAALGWAVLGESLSPSQLVGFAITLAAIAVGASWPGRADTPPATTVECTPPPTSRPAGHGVGPAASRHNSSRMHSTEPAPRTLHPDRPVRRMQGPDDLEAHVADQVAHAGWIEVVTASPLVTVRWARGAARAGSAS